MATPITIVIDAQRYVVANIDPGVFEVVVDGHGKAIIGPNDRLLDIPYADIEVVAIEPGETPEEASGDELKFMVFRDVNQAGLAAVHDEFYVFDEDRLEYASRFSDDTILSWAIGEPGGDGPTKTSSIFENIQSYAEVPHEKWDEEGELGLDVFEDALDPSGMARLAEAIGFIPRVAYSRW